MVSLLMLSTVYIMNCRVSRATLYYWVPQKLPQIYTVMAYICIGKVAWFGVYIFALIYGTPSTLVFLSAGSRAVLTRSSIRRFRGRCKVGTMSWKLEVVLVDRVATDSELGRYPAIFCLISGRIVNIYSLTDSLSGICFVVISFVFCF